MNIVNVERSLFQRCVSGIMVGRAGRREISEIMRKVSWWQGTSVEQYSI